MPILRIIHVNRKSERAGATRSTSIAPMLLALCLIARTTALQLPAHCWHSIGFQPGKWRLCAAAAADGMEGYAWESGVTCVEYEQGGELLLGVYVAYSVVNSQPHIRPLCASTEDDGVRLLLHDEDAPTAPVSSVKRILDPDYVFVSERQAGGGQGLGNPHGEHGEECYDLSDLIISAGVRVVVREGRDMERKL
jgi:hypothetical protein